MASIYDFLPDPDALLALEPEELAPVLLAYLNTSPNNLNRYNFSLPHTVQDYPPEYQDQVRLALMEAWVWLEREGLLIPKPGAQGEWMVISRRGQRMTTPDDLRTFQRSDLLPRHLLHPSLTKKVWPEFLRGDYDTAVFQAFKEVEVAVRDAGNFGPDEIGVDLVRKAFAIDNGPLTGTAAPQAEQVAMAHLFAGAVGSYKNPSSHRHVELGPEEAVELLLVASHLLRVVDRRIS